MLMYHIYPTPTPRHLQIQAALRDRASEYPDKIEQLLICEQDYFHCISAVDRERFGKQRILNLDNRGADQSGDLFLGRELQPYEEHQHQRGREAGGRGHHLHEEQDQRVSLLFEQLSHEGSALESRN